MTRPWTRGESRKTRPHALPAPGAPASGPRSPRAAWACLALALGSCSGNDVSPKPRDLSTPEARALRWISRQQLADGAFPTEGYLPREIGTAFVVGLLACATDEPSDFNPMLVRSIKFLEQRQSPDGAFRYAQCPDDAMNTSLTLLALFACRDRKDGCYRNDGGYVEVFDARLLHRFFRSAGKDFMTWDEFLQRSDLAVQTGDPDRPEPEDLFRAARRALRAKDAASAMEIRSRILLGQADDGSWAQDGPSAGRRIVAAACRIRTLELLRPILADTLVRR